MAAVQNASLHLPLAKATYVKLAEHGNLEGVWAAISGLSGWTVFFTILLGAVLYDQCEFATPECT